MGSSNQKVTRLKREIDQLSKEEWESLYNHMSESAEFIDLSEVEEECQHN